MLPKQAREAQAKHPVAWWSLMVATLTPMVAGVTALGFLAPRLFSFPALLQVLAGGCCLVAAIPPLMLVGAFSWLLVARGFVSRSVARAFFVHPGFGVLSRLSEWMFLRVYGSSDE